MVTIWRIQMNRKVSIHKCCKDEMVVAMIMMTIGVCRNGCDNLHEMVVDIAADGGVTCSCCCCCCCDDVVMVP